MLCLQSQYVFIVLLDIIILFIWWRCNTLKTWNYNHGQNAWDTFTYIGGVFFNSHISTPPSPPPLPHANNVGWMYPEFFRVSILYRLGSGRELQENFEKDAWFYKATRNYRKLWTLRHCPSDSCPGLQVCTVPAPLSRVHPEEKRRLFTRQLQQMIRNCRMFSRNFLLIPSLGLKRWFNCKCNLNKNAFPM